MAKKTNKIIDYISGIEVNATPEEVEAIQVFAKNLVEDYKYTKEQIITHPQYRVKARPSDTSGKYPVDIAVFKDSDKREVYIIVECKKKKRKDGRTQLEDYLRLSRAEFGVWFNGEERLFLHKKEEKGQVLFNEIPNIPLGGQTLADIGRLKKSELLPTHNLKTIFKSIRNYLAANTVGATRDEVLAQQLINLIFCKLYDEKYTAPQNIVRFRAEPDESPKEISKRINDLFIEVKSNQIEVFEKEDKLILDAKSIAYVVGELQYFSLMESERDVVADAFETFIDHALKGGQGQFFTPRNVVKMIIDIISPEENHKIIDPACGSGGFLIDALKHVWNKVDKRYSELGWTEIEIERKKIETASNNFRGIDKDYFLSKVAKAYMNLIGDGTTGIFCADSLENPKTWNSEMQDKIKLNEFDILITNPPFGSKIPVEGKSKLESYDFGFKWRFDKKDKKWIRTQKLKEREEPQVLFIERCLSLLKDGGKMAMVLPSGILGNERETYLREYITQKGNLFAIVELPFETFSPHVTINTSVLFIQKGNSNQNNDIFISINKYCGHDKKGRFISQDDISKVADFYNTQKSNENNFFIKQSLLEPNFVAKRYLQKYVDNIEEIKKSKHIVVKLGDIIKTVHNGANIDDASIYVEKDEGIPYILVKSITKEGINFENLKHIRKDLLNDKEVIKNIVTEETILMTRAGNSGISTNIPPDLKNGVASGFLINIHVDLTKVNQYYLVAYLNSDYGQLQLERISSGSILQSIRSSDLKNVDIILPPIEIQNKIGNKVKQAGYSQAEIRKNIEDAKNGINGLIPNAP